MMRKRVKLIHTPGTGWHVDLPTYTMVRNSVLPVIAGLTSANGVLLSADAGDPRLATLTCEVDCPDQYIDPATGLITPDKVRRDHTGHPNWDRPDKAWKL